VEWWYLIFIIPIIIVMLYYYKKLSAKKSPKRNYVSPIGNPTQTTPPSKVKNKTGWMKTTWNIIGLIVAAIVVIFLTIFLWNAGSTFVNWCKTPNYAPAPVSQEQHNPLSSGEGYVKTRLRAYLDPMKTHTRPIGVVKYILESNPSVSIKETGPAAGNNGIDYQKWLKMPAGIYIITSEDPNAYFKWWQ